MIFNREEQHLMLEGSVLSKEDVKRLVACHTEEASGIFVRTLPISGRVVQ